jgi:hypothetical protein
VADFLKNIVPQLYNSIGNTNVANLATRALSPTTDLIAKKPDGTLAISNPTNTYMNVGEVSRITAKFLPKATDKLDKSGNSTIVEDTKTTASYSRKTLPGLSPNVMEKFSSVNILWTLACLTRQQFNKPKSYRETPNSLSNIIFASGGRFDDQRVKTFFGTPEYYVNDFQMRCLISASTQTGNSNAFKFSFEIFEPYSMGLLLQSMQNAAVKAKYLSYLDNAPYVLRMDIQGYNELGQNISSVKPKFFVMKITSMKFTVNEGGSTYKVEAIPYNQQGFSDAMNVTYTDIKISGTKAGKGDVYDLLNGSENSLASALNKNEAKLVKEKRISIPDQYEIQFPKTASDWYSAGGTPPKTNKATEKPNLKYPITIAPGTTVTSAEPEKNDLAIASLGFDVLSGGNPLFQRSSDVWDTKTGVLKRDGITIDPKNRAFQFGQGQSLTSMINQVILSSDYAKKAITEKPFGPGYIKWFKLDVQIELLEYDALVADYAKKITYRVVPYFVHQSIFSNVTSAPVGYNELMKLIAKDYNYIYTGQNADIIKFEIAINNLFYTAGNPAPENQGSTTGNKDQQGIGERQNNTTKTGEGKAPAAQAAQMGRARTARDPKLLMGYKGGSSDKTTEQNIAETFQNAFISGSSADMVSVDLEILGDPYWLVDSGVGNYFANAGPEDQITEDGTMNYESGNIYVYLSFQTPIDINEKTGLYDFSTSGKESPFGGIYRVNACDNIFKDGQWTQKLKCLRMPGPQGPEVETNAVLEKGTPMPVSPTDNRVTEVGEPEATSTTVVESTGGARTVVPGSASAAVTPSTKGATTGGTTTTSNTSQPITGRYRYYRDSNTPVAAPTSNLPAAVAPAVAPVPVPFTSATTNNATTAAIARGPDQTVNFSDGTEANTGNWKPPGLRG